METETAGAGLPLSRVRVIADARHHLPAVAAIAAAEEARGFDARPDLVFLGPELERPDVGESAAVSFRKGRRRFGLPPGFSHLGRGSRVRRPPRSRFSRARARATRCWRERGRLLQERSAPIWSPSRFF